MKILGQRPFRQSILWRVLSVHKTDVRHIIYYQGGHMQMTTVNHQAIDGVLPGLHWIQCLDLRWKSFDPMRAPQPMYSNSDTVTGFMATSTSSTISRFSLGAHTWNWIHLRSYAYDEPWEYEFAVKGLSHIQILFLWSTFLYNLITISSNLNFLLTKRTLHQGSLSSSLRLTQSKSQTIETAISVFTLKRADHSFNQHNNWGKSK
jgi:hypothetical protein